MQKRCAGAHLKGGWQNLLVLKRLNCKMIKAVKIKGDESQILSASLKDVLSCINCGENLYWGLLWVEAVAELGRRESIIDLEKNINKSEKATIVGWIELLNLSTEIIQAIDLLIIGDGRCSNIRKYPKNEDMYLNCDYTIELIDSSYWIIHTKDDVFLKNVFEKLKGVEYILN